jgi:UDP-N-acetylmuramoylalanine--D-glutamate ligase
MIVLATRAHQKIGVLGLGSSGLVAARALKAGGADVVAWDDNASARQRAQAEGRCPIWQRPIGRSCRRW